MLLNRFNKDNEQGLESMSESEIWNLNMWERIERALIINGNVTHGLCRLIDVQDVRPCGADSFTFNVISTLRGKRKPSYRHHIVYNNVNGYMEVTEFDVL